MFISQEWPKRAEKASLLTASGMLLHAFSSMFVSSLREFPKNCVYKHGELNCFTQYLHRILLAANFLSYDIESARKYAFIGIAYYNNKFLVL